MTSDVSQKRDEAPFDLAERDLIRQMRDVLADVQYESQAILEVLGVRDFPELGDSDVDWLVSSTDGGSPLETLVRLLLIGVTVPVEAASRAVRPMALDDWCRVGLLAVEGDQVRGTGQLLPFKHLLLFADLPLGRGGPLRPDHVMSVGSSSITLATITVRHAIDRALDLGTGGGIQAFLAAPHSRHVVAVDRNQRAVNVAAFNACLNGLDNVESRAGDFFEPVAGERFDLIVTNPPFVVSPERRYIYRDGGMHGDQVCQRIVREAPPLMNEGGYCQMLCNWAHLEGQPWQERLAGWFAGCECDVWVMRSETRDAATYARHWIRHTERDAAGNFARRFDDWMHYYAAEGIVEMSAGVIAMRRRSGSDHWLKIDDVPPQMLGPCGDDVHRIFQLRDALAEMQSDEVLMNQRLRVAPDVRLDQQFAPSEEGWYAAESNLRHTAGLAYSGSVDPYTAHMLGRCNGQRTAREVLSEMAERVNEPLDRVAPDWLRILRRLIEQGFLLPESLAK